MLKYLVSMNWHLNVQTVRSSEVNTVFQSHNMFIIYYCSLRTYFDMLQVAAHAHVINVKRYVEDIGPCPEDEKRVLLFHLNEARLVRVTTF